MKKEITEEEYNYILTRLEFITAEKERLKTLSTTNNYIAHIQLAESFGELLINIKRENLKLDTTIKNAKKEFLETLNLSSKTKKDVSAAIENLINRLENTTIEEKTPELTQELLTMSVHYDSFQTMYTKVKQSIYQKQANTYLENYILTLEEESDTLRNRKYQYERTQKRKLLLKKSLLKSNSKI